MEFERFLFRLSSFPSKTLFTMKNESVFEYNICTCCFTYFRCIIQRVIFSLLFFFSSMEDNCTGEFENIVTSVYTITNDPRFCSLGFKPQCLTKVLKKTTNEQNGFVIFARRFLNIPMDAALHFIVVILLVFIVINLTCKLLLYVFM